MEYTYKCQKCGEFKVEHSMNEEVLKECPKCGQTISRVFKPSAAIWKCDGAFGKSK
jgi:putative FmdB family regulatory protein